MCISRQINGIKLIYINVFLYHILRKLFNKVALYMFYISVDKNVIIP